MIERVIHFASSARVAWLLFLVVGLFAGACDGSGKNEEQSVAQTSQPTTSQPPKKKPPAPAPPVVRGHPIPVGPRIVFLPGQGAGAIFFGANFDTVERHMAAPCEIRTETRCGYVKLAIEFEMKDGVVAKIKAFRRGRQVSGAKSEKEGYYGTFRGIVQPKIMLGLHRRVVVEEFGEPRKKIPLQGDEGQVERHEYDGITFEYDEIENGNTVLSVIEVVPSKTARPGPQKSRRKDAASEKPKER